MGGTLLQKQGDEWVVIGYHTESLMTRLKTLLLKLSEYTIDLKYQKGSEMHRSDTLSRLHKFTDTPTRKMLYL